MFMLGTTLTRTNEKKKIIIIVAYFIYQLNVLYTKINIVMF